MTRPFVDNFIFFDNYSVDKLFSITEWLSSNQLDDLYRDDGFGRYPTGDGSSFYGIGHISFPQNIFCDKTYTDKWKDLCEVVEPCLIFMQGQLSAFGEYQPWNVEINIVPPGLAIKPHVDNHAGVGKDFRLHIVVSTNDAVEFIVEDKVRHLPQGSCFAFDNSKIHSVVNNHDSLSRIHLIADFRLVV